MKKIALFAIVALTGSFAMADGGDHQQYVYPKFDGVYTKCTEGAKQIFAEPRANGLDGMVNVTRTCVNGSYYPKSTVTIRKCTEGNTTFVTEHNSINDRSKTVVYVCQNGKYVSRGY